MKILVVDDERSIVDLYAIFLGNAGHEVVATEFPEQAMEFIKNDSFDLVITDKKMPKITGLDIIKLVEDTKHETPVFLITGDNTDSINFKNSKSNVYKKPISFEELVIKVSAIAC